VTAIAIARVELLRLFRDRSNVFFVLVLPLMLVLLIGAQFGGSFDARIGIVGPSGDAAVAAVADTLEATDGLTAVTVADTDALVDAVGRGELSAGLAFPDGFEQALEAAEPVTVDYVGRPDATAMSLRQIVAAVVVDQAAPSGAAAVAAPLLGGSAAELVPVARQVASQVPTIEVVTEALGGDELTREFAGLGQFDLGASSQLFLFTFLTALSGGAALIQTRQYGIASRMLSTPTRMSAILGGEAGGRILVALAQAAYIVVVTLLLFQVDWGDPVATGTVVVLFCIVAGGAGMLIGATLKNDSQAAGAGVGLGIGLAALGGSMVPLEIFPDAVLPFAYATPHAWANRAMAEIVRRDGTLADVGLEVAVLAGFAVLLLGLATWRLQRTLVR
jgi:ABC-2 type transport system permease protein